MTILDPTTFVACRCLACGRMSWLAAGSVCPSPAVPLDLPAGCGVVVRSSQLPCGGPLEQLDHEMQEAFAGAYRTGGWPAVFFMLS